MGVYYVAGVPYTDELYHMIDGGTTFGRMDENELWHYGIKGQSWGKRRFQNEDGSLTAAGRNRYDVGDPRRGVTEYSDTGGRGGSGVIHYKTPTYGGTSNTSARVPARTQGVSQQTRSNVANRVSNIRGNITARNRTPITPLKTQGVSQQTRSDIANRNSAIRSNITSRTEAGKKAADNIFGRIGNWANQAAKDVGNAATGAYNSAKTWTGQAAKDVGNFATNAYNDVSKAVSGAANDVGNWAGNAVNDVSKWGNQAIKDVGNAVSNSNAKTNMDNAQRRADLALNTAIQRSGEYVPDGRGGEDLYIRDANDAKMVDIAERQAAKAKEQYENHPVTKLQNAANDVGDFANTTYNRAREFAKGVGSDVSDAVGNAYDSVKDTVNDTAKGISNWYTGEGDKKVADWYRNLADRDTNFLGTGQNLIEDHQAVADESRAMAEAYRKAGDYKNAERYEQNAKAYQNAVDQMTRERNQNLKTADNYDERYNNSPRQVLSNLPSNVGNAVSGAAKDAGNWVSNAYNDVSKAVSGAANDVGNWAGNAANDVSKWGNQAIKDVGQAANNVGNAVSGAAKDAGNWVSNAYNDVSNWVTGNKARDDLERAQNWFVGGREDAQKAYDRTLPGMVQNVGNTAGSLAEATRNWLNQTGQNVGNWGNQAIKDVGQAANNVGNAVSGAANNVGNWVGNAYNDVSKAVSGAANDVGNWGNQAIKDVGQAANNVGNAVSGAAKDAGNWVSNAYNDVSKAVSGAANDVGNWGNQAIKDVGQAANNVGNWAGNTARNLSTTIQDVFNGSAGDEQVAELRRVLANEDLPSDIRLDIQNALNKRMQENKERNSVVSNVANAASDVANWGGEQVNNGKKLLKKIFG